MVDQLPKKTKAKPQVGKPTEAETNPTATDIVNSKEEEKPSSSEIAAKALPNIEPHVYKPETPVAAATAVVQDTPATSETPAQSSAPEQKPSPLEEDSIVANEPLFEPEVKSNKKLYLIAAVVVIGLIAASVAFFMNYSKNKNAAEKKAEPSQSEQTSAPIVTEVKESEGIFDRSKITLEVLNGSGIAGAAKKVADSLSALEYQIIEVGNAQENSETSQIFVSIDLEKFQSEFLKDLDGIIPEATISGKLEDSTASARIIIGKN